MEHKNLHIVNISKEIYANLLRVAENKLEAIVLCKRLLVRHIVYNPATSKGLQRFFDELMLAKASQDSEKNARQNWRASDSLVKLEKLGITGKRIPELFMANNSDINKMYISLLTGAASEIIEKAKKQTWWESLLRRNPKEKMQTSEESKCLLILFEYFLYFVINI